MSETTRRPECAPHPSPRELAAAEAIQAIDKQMGEGDPDWPTLTPRGALDFAAAAIAAAQVVDFENGIDRIRRTEIQKLRTRLCKVAAVLTAIEVHASLDSSPVEYRTLGGWVDVEDALAVALAEGVAE